MNKPDPSPLRVLILCCTLSFIIPLKAQLTLLGSFDPTNAGGFCGITYDTDSARIWAYDCDASVIYQYATDGTFIRSIP
ncbi:MAG: hypothetical protein IT227_14440, partial [Flavobacteriales bacterium]|nr:hypothetical protein [Flavobacteriales bacterium]